VIQDLIDEGKLQVDTPLPNPKQELGIYQNPLLHHVNNILSILNQVTHKLNPNQIEYISMISVATRAQKNQNKQTTTINQQHVIPDIPRPQHLKVLVKGVLQQQLKSSQVKLSLFNLLQQSKDHRDAMNHILQKLELDINDPKSFTTLVGNIKQIQRPVITFYDHEIKHLKNSSQIDPPLHIVANVDGKMFKQILIDEGSTINIISTIAFLNLNIPFSHIKAPTLQLKAFNDALFFTIGSISIPIMVGSKTVQTVLQVIEGDITQYNILLG